MRTILLPFQDGEGARSTLELAYLVARRFGSYIEGLFVRQPPPIIAGEGITIPGEYLTQLAEEGRRQAENAHRRFTEFMNEKNVPLEDVTFSTSEPSSGWREVEGLEAQIVGDYGRLFDLIVIGCATDQSSVDRNALCEAALFDSGRPVMVAAPKPPQKLGETVVVAWNGSTETACTIGLGMPFLAGAKKVVVVTVEGGTVPGPTGEQVANHLVRNGVNAQARLIQPNDRTPGEALLEETAALGADLLLKGAYTHSRLRQLIFGGTTKHILAVADLPVFMAH